MFLCIFLWFYSVFTAELLRRKNVHLRAAKHRHGASSVLLLYLISVRQTPFWKELMFLPIQFWFTVQHFLHSNTLGRTVNYIFLFIFYLYSWMKWRNYWFILQSLFPPCSKSATFFVIGELHVEYIPVIWGWRCELFAWKHVAWYAPHGEYVLLTDVYPHIPSKASECAFHQNQRIDVRHFTAKVLDFFFLLFMNTDHNIWCSH